MLVNSLMFVKHVMKDFHTNIHCSTHTSEKTVLCEICNKGFSKKGNLNNHIRTYAGVKA